MSQAAGSDAYFEGISDDELARIPIPVVLAQSEADKHRQLRQQLAFSSSPDAPQPAGSSLNDAPTRSSISFDGVGMGSPWTQAGVTSTAHMRDQWHRSAVNRLPSSSPNRATTPEARPARSVAKRNLGNLFEQLDAQLSDFENSASDSAKANARQKGTTKSRAVRSTSSKLKLPNDAPAAKRAATKSPASDDSSLPLSHLTAHPQIESDKENRPPLRSHQQSPMSGSSTPARGPASKGRKGNVICIESEDEQETAARANGSRATHKSPVKETGNAFEILMSSPILCATSPKKRKSSRPSSPSKAPGSRLSASPAKLNFASNEIGECFARLSKDHPLFVESPNASGSNLARVPRQRPTAVSDDQVICLTDSTDPIRTPPYPPQADFDARDDLKCFELDGDDELILQAAEQSSAISRGPRAIQGEPLDIVMIRDMPSEDQDRFRSQFDRAIRRQNGTGPSQVGDTDAARRIRRGGKQKTWKTTMAAADGHLDEDEGDEHGSVTSSRGRASTSSRGKGGTKSVKSAYFKRKGFAARFNGRRR